MTKRGVTIAIAVAVALVIARSAVFLLWEQSAFDSDQAIFGLMAKHIAEGRAFPMFIYGDRYLMAVQAWLAAPLFLVFEPSVALLKLPVVLINAATAALLVFVLHRDARLRPATALLASLFFAAMPPIMAKLLAETGGGNPEPFLYVLLLWVLRARPLAFGLVFAFGFVHREFTVYGVTALVAIAVLADRRLNYERFKAVALAGIGFFVVSQAIRAAYLFSNPLGPGSAIAVPLAGTDNIGGLAGRYCFAPETILPSMASLFGNFFGVVFGATNHRFVDFGLRSTLSAGRTGRRGILARARADSRRGAGACRLDQHARSETDVDGTGRGGSVSAARRSAIRRGLCRGAVRTARARHPALRALDGVCRHWRRNAVFRVRTASRLAPCHGRGRRGVDRHQRGEPRAVGRRIPSTANQVARIERWPITSSRPASNTRARTIGRLISPPSIPANA